LKISGEIQIHLEIDTTVIEGRRENMRTQSEEGKSSIEEGEDFAG